MHCQSVFISVNRLITVIGLTLALISAPLTPGKVLASAEWKRQLAEGEKKLKIQEFAAAELCFRQAVKDVRKSREHSPIDVASCMLSLASLLQIEDKTEEALPLYKKSLRILKKAYGKNSAKIVPTLLVLGGIWESEGEYRRALKLYKRAALLAENIEEGQSLLYAECQYHLGHVFFKQGSFQQAESFYNNALVIIMHQSHLPSDELLASLLDDYIDLLSKTNCERSILSGDFQRQLLKDQIALVERTKAISASGWDTTVLGQLKSDRDQAPTSQARINHDSLMEKESQPTPMAATKETSDSMKSDLFNQQRIDFYKRMIATDIDSLGPDHPSVARDLYGLASVYLAQNKYSEARPLLLRALQIYRKVYKADTQPIRTMQSLLNLISEERNTLLKIDDCTTSYLAHLPHIPLEAEKLEIALQLNYLALLCLSKGRVEAADRIYAWALTSTALACGEQSLLVASCLTDYGRLLRHLGRQSEAEQMEADAHIIVRQTLLKQATLVLPK